MDYQTVLAASLRAQWQIDDVLRADEELDFSRPFLPEGLARTARAVGLDEGERQTLNHLAAYEYIWMFGTVEEYVLPFVLDHARPMLAHADYRVQALLNFAGEEAKHIQLFRRFAMAFARGFPTPPRLVNPRPFADAVLAKSPLGVALSILMVEWMTQHHYVSAVRDETGIDPLFQKLLKYHWMEEAQHAKLDTLIVEALAEGQPPAVLRQGLTDFFAILRLIDAGLQVQAKFNVEALQIAIGRRLPNAQQIVAQQLAASRAAFIGAGLTHERFRATVGKISPQALAAVDKVGASVGASSEAPSREVAVAEPVS